MTRLFFRQYLFLFGLCLGGILLTAPSVSAQRIILPSFEKSQLGNSESDARIETNRTDQPPARALTIQTPPTRASRGTNDFFKDLLRDQKRIWTSPFRLQKKDWQWLVPLTALTVVTVATDDGVSDRIVRNEEAFEVSPDISKLGSGYVTFGAAGLMVTLGGLTGNQKVKETGILSAQALIHTNLVVGGIKLLVGRQRPVTDEEHNPGVLKVHGKFLGRDDSFPSGHSASIWALATVIGEQYRNKPLIRFSAYGVATVVGLARLTGGNHFPSDALVGSAIGYLIGRYTIRRYSSFQEHPMPIITPYISHRTRTYGVSASVKF